MPLPRESLTAVAVVDTLPDPECSLPEGTFVATSAEQYASALAEVRGDRRGMAYVDVRTCLGASALKCNDDCVRYAVFFKPNLFADFGRTAMETVAGQVQGVAERATYVSGVQHLELLEQDPRLHSNVAFAPQKPNDAENEQEQ